MVIKHVLRLQPYFWRLNSGTLRFLKTTQSPLLAGHSKWANIRHIKAQKDGERAALFTRISRQIRLAIQEGGSFDPAINSTLKSVMDEALRKNMPIASIQSTIKKCQQSKTELKKYVVEMRYKQKVFMILTLFTDNFAMAKQEMATVLRKNGATFMDVSHLFDSIGIIDATLENPTNMNLEERATEDAIECGAEDVEVLSAETSALSFFCSPNQLNGVRNAIEARNYKIDSSNHIFTPKNTVALTQEELKAYEKFVDKLRNMTGVEDIFDNVQYDDA